MATSTPGIGSGLDVNSIVNQLVAVERQPLQKLQQRATTIQTQISSWGKLKGLVDTLRSTVSKLSTASTWSQSQVTSSDPSTVAASRAATGTASPGRYAVTVSQLAQPQVLNSATIAGGSDLRGRLRIELGSYDSASPPGFTARSGSTAIELDFTDSATTLTSVRDAINAANGGVSASILSDANGSRLVLSSTETGRDRAMKITVSSTTVTTTNSGTSGTQSGSSSGLSDPMSMLSGMMGSGQSSSSSTPGNTTTSTVNPTGLTALAYDGSSSSAMTQARAAQDASFAVNGVAMVSSSNTLEGTLAGVRLQLLKVSAQPIDVLVEADSGGQRKAIEDFVAAYNAINTQISADTGFDAASRKGGIFQGDFAALTVRRQLRDLVGQSSSASSTFQRLSDLGLDIKRDGSISVDSTRLGNALNNGTEIAKFLSAAGGPTEESKGLAVRLKTLTDSLLGADGPVDSKAESLQDRLKRNQSDQDRLNARVEATRLRLLRLYQSLDGRVSQLNGLGTYVAQQFSNR